MTTTEAESESGAKAGGLLLDSLEITNFRTFRHLKINRLGRVNLIVGKNGVGKSTVLEAIHIYTDADALAAVCDVLFVRDEFTRKIMHTGTAHVSAHDVMFN